MRASEAVAARNTVIEHFAVACKSIKEKTAAIGTLQREKSELESKLTLQNGEALLAQNGSDNTFVDNQKHMGEEITRLEHTIQTLRDELNALKRASSVSKELPDDPPMYEEGQRDAVQVTIM